MDAVTAITNDHRRMEALFDKLRSAGEDRTPLVAEVKARLTAHSVAEEEHVYPALVGNDPAEQDEVHHGVEEHREARRGWRPWRRRSAGLASMKRWRSSSAR